MTGEQWIQKARELFKEIAAENKATETRVYKQNMETLTDLLKDAARLYDTSDSECDMEEFLADYLLNHNVIVLPCAVGDTVFEVVYEHCCTDSDLDYYTVVEDKFQLGSVYEIGRDIFLSRNEAEAEANRRNKELEQK